MKKVLSIVAGLAALALALSCQNNTAPASKELNVFNWSAYMPEKVKEDFTAETGIKLNYEEFDSNETMLAKITAGAKYDVTFPSQDFVPIMIEKGLIQPIDRSKLSNLKNIDANVLAMTKSFDPEEKYSVPYNIGAIGILYWKDKVKNPGDSWALLSRPDLKGRVVIMDDTRQVFGAALKLLGYSVNTTDPTQIDAATKTILGWKDVAMSFDSEQMPTLFNNKEVWVAVGYPENVLSEREGDTHPADVGFFIPKEFGPKYLDNMVILKDAANLENAYTFINFIYRPENLAQIFDAYGYPGVSEASKPLRKEQPYYSTAQLDNNEFIFSVGDKIDLYTKAWEEKVKIGQ